MSHEAVNHVLENDPRWCFAGLAELPARTLIIDPRDGLCVLTADPVLDDQGRLRVQSLDGALSIREEDFDQRFWVLSPCPGPTAAAIARVPTGTTVR